MIATEAVETSISNNLSQVHINLRKTARDSLLCRFFKMATIDDLGGNLDCVTNIMTPTVNLNKDIAKTKSEI